MLLVKHSMAAFRIAWGLRAGWGASGSLLALGAMMYVAGFLAWMVILARTPLMIAYPVAVGLTMAFSALGAALFLNENMSPVMFIGVILIFAGVVVLARA